jgi:hypothetical protein
VKEGSSHTEQARVAIGAGVRRRFQERREHASLVVYAIDETLELIQDAEQSIVVGADRDEVERKVALALEAMRQTAALVRSPSP